MTKLRPFSASLFLVFLGLWWTLNTYFPNVYCLLFSISFLALIAYLIYRTVFLVIAYLRSYK